MLNDVLYRRLCARLSGGVITVAHQGEGAGLKPVPIHKWRPGRPRYYMAGGEEYRVCCPFCRDQRGHLYINHLYGTIDEAGFENLHLATCFRRHCTDNPDNRRELARLIWGDMPADRRRGIQVREGAAPTHDPATLTTAAHPGLVVPLSQLPADHPARAYLKSRNFDPDELSLLWQVGFCLPPGDPMACHRIYVPFYQSGRLVGWQARWPGELNWKASGIRKYYNRRNFHRRLYLYGEDQAAGVPYVVLVEGVSDLWRAGPPALSLLGKTLSATQCERLITTWGKLPIGVCLDNDDPDAPDAARKIYNMLAEYGASLPFIATLPGGRDPADCTREEFWSHVTACAHSASVKV